MKLSREDLFREIRRILDDERSAGGLNIGEQMAVPPGLFLSRVTSKDVQTRDSSEPKQRVMALVDEALAELALTEGCKKSIKDQVSVFFDMDLGTQSIMAIIIEPFDQIERQTPGGYEKERLHNNTEALSSEVVIRAKAPDFVAWGEQIVAAYGNDPQTDGHLEYFRFVVEKTKEAAQVASGEQ
jgi:hypothetical protein